MPWHKVPPKVISTGADSKESYSYPKHLLVSSQYCLNEDLNNPAAPVGTNHADQYISSNDDGNSKLSPLLTSSPHVKRSFEEYAHLVDVVKIQLPQASEEHCMEYLTKNQGNVELTLQDLRVQILMDMNLPNTNMDSCRKALSHCQWKLDRAAEWLIEQNSL